MFVFFIVVIAAFIGIIDPGQAVGSRLVKSSRYLYY